MNVRLRRRVVFVSGRSVGVALQANRCLVKQMKTGFYRGRVFKVLLFLRQEVEV